MMACYAKNWENKVINGKSKKQIKRLWRSLIIARWPPSSWRQLLMPVLHKLTFRINNMNWA